MIQKGEYKPMKNRYHLLCLLLLFSLILLLFACASKSGGDQTEESGTNVATSSETLTDTEATHTTDGVETEVSETEEMTEGEEPVTKAPITSIAFEEIKAAENLEKFIAEVDYEDGNHNNEAMEVGAVISPYFTMKINDTDVACYAVRTAIGAHSFAMIDASEASFPLKIDLGVLTDCRKVAILPEHYGVKAEKTEGGATATVDSFGNYTFVLDGDKTKAITLFVRADEAYQAPEGYEVIKVAPGVHSEKIEFTAEKQVLYFEAGTHELKYNIEFKNNTEVYLERGAYIYAIMPDMEEKPFLNPAWSGKVRWYALFQGNGVSNVRISGRGFIDLSRLDWHARSGIQFDLCQNVTVEGVTINNSPEWTLYFTQCEGINVKEVMLFGYRQNSDGIAVVDSANALVKDCFARSGDDLFEVKSMYGGCTIKIENIVFDNCNAWPDKARGLGIIAETARDMTNITFKNCSVGFASATWMEDLAGLVVYTEGPAKITNVNFESIELYECDKYPINVTVGDKSRAQISGLFFRDIAINGSKKIRICNRSTVGGAINGITFENCTRNGKLASSNRVLNLSMENVDESVVTITAEEAP